MVMELPDEALTYHYQSLLAPAAEEWTAAAELRAAHRVAPARLKELMPRVLQCRSQIAADRETRLIPPESMPLDAGFIDLPQQQLDQLRRKNELSEVGQVLALADRLREDADRVVLLGVGGSALGPRALFEALRSVYHNELPPETRLGVPRLYFAGDSFDNDSLQDLLDLLQITCVDPEQRSERWAVVYISRSGTTWEPALTHRVFRREATEFYGLRSPWLAQLFATVTGTTSRLRELYRALGHGPDSMLTIPDQVSGRFSVFSPAGLLPAALAGLDVRALLLGAAAMTKRFLEDPFERNPVLQYASLNYLLAEEHGKSIRVLQPWSRKLEGVGRWYEHLLSESLGKQGRGPTPMTLVATRDLHARAQQHQEGRRDRVINNLIVKVPRSIPIAVQMADHNQDDLNSLNRRSLPDLQQATLRSLNQAYDEAARPTADLVIPSLSEHALGQLMQMLMLATVVEGRLMGINPYGQSGAAIYRRHVMEQLKAMDAAAGAVPKAGH